mgnify:CR=1 FL=1
MVQKTNKVHKMTLTAILMAIILVMSFTPLGYLRVGPVAITFLTIPVVIGAVLLGPWYGAFLGAVFGATSFSTCFGADPMGVALLSIDPVATFFTCMVPRILIGVVTGLLFRALCRRGHNNAFVLILTTLVGCLTNTVLFVSAVIFFFQSTYFGGDSLGNIIVMFFTVNALLEVVVCGLVAAGCSKALSSVMLRKISA